MWKTKWKNQTKCVLSKVGKIQKARVKSGDQLLWTQKNTHNVMDGVSATKENEQGNKKDLTKTNARCHANTRRDRGLAAKIEKQQDLH